LATKRLFAVVSLLYLAVLVFSLFPNITNSESVSTFFNYQDPESDWTGEPEAYDLYEGPIGAAASIDPESWVGYLVLNCTPTQSTQVQALITVSGEYADWITVDIYNGSWNNIYNNTFITECLAWYYFNYSVTTLTAIRMKFYNPNAVLDDIIFIQEVYLNHAWKYIVYGPYWESGSVATTIINVTININNTDPYHFQLNGTSGTADNETVATNEQGIALTWNFTTYMNYTRTYFLTNQSFEEIWLYIPNVTEESVSIYTFTVTDMVGVTNAYLETVHTVGGQNRIVERQSLGVINSVPFWMVWSHRYDIRLVCDQGTHNWGAFIASSEQQQNLIIIEGMFPVSYPGLDVTVKAKRMNAIWIQTNYTDSKNYTSWLQIIIQYKKGYSWTTAYTSSNYTTFPVQDNWKLADNKTDYVAKVTACRSGETKTWSFSCPKPKVDVNPWAGLFEGLGTSWPFDPQYLMGVFLTLAVFAVFSYANMPLGCILGCIMAAFLNLIGWLNINWSLLSLAFCIGIFAAIAQAKKQEREI